MTRSSAPPTTSSRWDPAPATTAGEVVAQGPVDAVLRDPDSLTGQYLGGTVSIPLPEARRATNGHNLVIRGARENNLRDLDVTIPLGVFTCITGVSGIRKEQPDPRDPLQGALRDACTTAACCPASTAPWRASTT